MMAMISPAIDAFQETLSSVKFANRAKNIKNQPIINEDVDQVYLLNDINFNILFFVKTIHLLQYLLNTNLKFLIL